MPETINGTVVSMPPIQLRGYYVRKFDFRINPDFDPQKPTESRFSDLQFEFQLGALSQEDAQNYLVDSEMYEFWESAFSLEYVSNELNKTNFPYYFSIGITGLFCLNKKADEEKAVQIEHNSQSILYGIVREIVSSFMDKGPFPSPILPTLFFSPANIASPDKA